MKGRKRKRKLKQDSRPAEQVVIRGESKEIASRVEIQVEIENVASPVEIRDETENPSNPVVRSADTEEPAPDSAAPTGADRRAQPRYTFTAAIEVVAPELGARIKARVRELSQQGCYVDTDRPLPLGTTTDVRITKGAKSFAARARVVYNQPSKGMGLMFTAVEPEQLGTLDTWIAESREASCPGGCPDGLRVPPARTETHLLAQQACWSFRIPVGGGAVESHFHIFPLGLPTKCSL